MKNPKQITQKERDLETWRMIERHIEAGTINTASQEEKQQAIELINRELEHDRKHAEAQRRYRERKKKLLTLEG